MPPLETVAFAILYVIIVTFALGAVSAAPWVRTKKPQRELVCREIDLSPNAKVYDLGCGDGAMLFSLVRKFPGITAVGYEIALVPFAWGVATKWLGGRAYRNVSIRCRDLFGRSYADADAVFIFLLGPVYPKLIAKLSGELRDDAQIIVEAWPFPGIDAERVIPGTAETVPVFFYRGHQLKRNANV